jgi:hypothetical protein
LHMHMIGGPKQEIARQSSYLFLRTSQKIHAVADTKKNNRPNILVNTAVFYIIYS